MNLNTISLAASDVVLETKVLVSRRLDDKKKSWSWSWQKSLENFQDFYVTVKCATRDWVLVLFSTVLSQLVYIRPTVFISYTAMRVVCILFCSFCDHDMVTCSVVRVKSWCWSWSWKKKSWSWSWQKSLIYITACSRKDVHLSPGKMIFAVLELWLSPLQWVLNW